ncbi:MAG: hypothetical protein KGI27_13545 [Thaumarchaeota archaeon]|nr:hypothetical protein [Nitrososphaerota archaeon]
MTKLPNDLDKLKKIKASLLQKEEEIRQIKNLKGEILDLMTKQEKRKKWKKLERQQKIRKFFHLPPKTMIESGLFEDQSSIES